MDVDKKRYHYNLSIIQEKNNKCSLTNLGDNILQEPQAVRVCWTGNPQARYQHCCVCYRQQQRITEL